MLNLSPQRKKMYLKLPLQSQVLLLVVYKTVWREKVQRAAILFEFPPQGCPPSGTSVMNSHHRHMSATFGNLQSSLSSGDYCHRTHMFSSTEINGNKGGKNAICWMETPKDKDKSERQKGATLMSMLGSMNYASGSKYESKTKRNRSSLWTLLAVWNRFSQIQNLTWVQYSELCFGVPTFLLTIINRSCSLVLSYWEVNL